MTSSFAFRSACCEIRHIPVDLANFLIHNDDDQAIQRPCHVSDPGWHLLTGYRCECRCHTPSTNNKNNKKLQSWSNLKFVEFRRRQKVVAFSPQPVSALCHHRGSCIIQRKRTERLTTNDATTLNDCSVWSKFKPHFGQAINRYSWTAKMAESGGERSALMTPISSR